MTKIIIRRHKQETTTTLPEHIHPVLRRVYKNRGIASEDELNTELPGLLPFTDLLGIDKAIEILYAALQQQERVLIVGDFDADGATSTAVAISALRSFGFLHVNFIVPNRFEYGYGLTPEIVAAACQWQPDIIITVDNGISSCAGAAYAKEQGMQVIVTDHHLPGAELPAADAIVNPNQVGCPFASKNLAGVGVIFYVMLALRSYLRDKNWFAIQHLPVPNMGQLLDLVALGTVADVVPLDRNNRILVRQGLQRIRAGKSRIGIDALLAVAKRQAENVTASDMGFALGPRLNAAGRLDDMSLGIHCLLCDDPIMAKRMALNLDNLNKERRSIEETMQEQAQQALAKFDRQHEHDSENLPLGVCLFDPQWHQGVIGILAGRLKDKLHRPVIAFAVANDDEVKGSARSIAGVHIRDVLDAIAKQYPELISKFGGHAMAAGLTIKRSDFPAFAQAFAAQVSQHCDADILQSKIYSDGELQAEDFSLSLAQSLRAAGPWGQAFPEPLFDGQFEVLKQRVVGEKHLKLLLRPLNSDQALDAIFFNPDLDAWGNTTAAATRQHVTLAYRLDVNHYRGEENVQLVVELALEKEQVLAEQVVME